MKNDKKRGYDRKKPKGCKAIEMQRQDTFCTVIEKIQL